MAWLGKKGQVVGLRLLQHPFLDGRLRLGISLLGGDLAVEVWLHCIAVDLVYDRRHDEKREHQRQPGKELVRGDVREAERLAREGQNDDYAGETGEQYQQ